MEERLQKILAHAGIASRRQAEQLIQEGRVRLNGHVVQQMGVRANPREDTITVDGRRIRKLRSFTYLLLNKPRNVMCTVRDPEGRPTVVDLVGEFDGTRLYPVGRLDFGSEGLLILTNDGEFTRFMTRAGGAAKVYGIKVSGVPSAATLDRLRRGARVDGRSYAPCEIRTVSEEANSWYEVTLHEGQNRQLRRMFEAAGHRVMRLRRTHIGFLSAPTLPPGKWRHLTAREVQEFYRRYGSDAGPQLPATAANGPAGRAAQTSGRYREAPAAGGRTPSIRRGKKPASARARSASAGRSGKPAAHRGNKPATGPGPRRSPDGRKRSGPVSGRSQRPSAGAPGKAGRPRAEGRARTQSRAKKSRRPGG